MYAYENMSFLEEQERYAAQGLEYHPSDKGSCSNFNMLSVHCIRYPDKCKQFAEECIKLATGGQDNKYYHTAVVSGKSQRTVPDGTQGNNKSVDPELSCFYILGRDFIFGWGNFDINQRGNGMAWI